MKKVLYISYDGLTDPLGQSQILPYLRELSKYEFQFFILSFEKKERYEKESSAVRNIVHASGMQWVPLWFTSKPPVLSKMIDRWKLRLTARRLLKREKFDLIHCRSYVAAEAGLSLKQKFNTKFLFDMRGFWADEKVDNGQWNQKHLLYRLIFRHYKKKEREFLLNADGIITLTQAAKHFLLSKPEYKDLSIEVIPCCADLDHFDFHKISEEQTSALKKDLKIPARAKVITYLGSAGGWYMIREMFSFFKIVTDRYSGYVMLVLTKDNPAKIKEEASLVGIQEDKIIISYSTRDKLPQFLALSNSSIFFIRNTFSKIASSPTKHGELMGMGIPVICNDIGDTGNIVTGTRTGLVIKDFTTSSLQYFAEQMPSLERIDKEYIRSHTKIFDLKAGVQQYLKEYSRIVC